jgi:hypothetical protein
LQVKIGPKSQPIDLLWESVFMDLNAAAPETSGRETRAVLLSSVNMPPLTSGPANVFALPRS